MIKNIVSVLICLLLVISLVSCSSQKPTPAVKPVIVSPTVVSTPEPIKPYVANSAAGAMDVAKDMLTNAVVDGMSSNNFRGTYTIGYSECLSQNGYYTVYAPVEISCDDGICVTCRANVVIRYDNGQYIRVRSWVDKVVKTTNFAQPE